jgi:anaerobic magnesium-protoporphyrin IX monomethyl ester cyclase
MSYFKNVCLVKAPQAFDIPHPQNISDLTEICYLAAVIENEVETVSMPVDFYSKNPYETFVRFLKKNAVDLVGISSMTGAFNNALKLAEIAKRFDKYVVMGGYHPTALPEDVLKSPYVDAVIIGEGDMTFKDLVINGPSRDVAGMTFMENGEIAHTGCRPLIKDLDGLPHPLRHIRPPRFGEPGDEYSIDTVYTSRGCPWTCTFCANDTVNKRWRARSPENVIEELAQLHDPKRKKLIKIWDANFLTNVKRVGKLCDLMIENKLTHFKIWTETSVGDIVRAENIMEKLYRVGLRNISLGIESPNAETLKLMNKKNRDDICVKAVEILNKNKIKPQGYFIIGHYRETLEDTMRYPEYAESLGLRHSIFMVMTPYPGTKIYNEYKQENKIINFNWDLYNNFGTVVETKGMDLKTLKKMYAYCWGRFYVRYTFFNEKKPFGIAFGLLQYLLMLYTIFKIDKDNTKEEIKDYIFGYLEAGCLNLTRPYHVKPPLFMRWFGEITLRFTHSPGKNIDFLIMQTEDSRSLRWRRTDESGLVRGYTFDLDKIIKLGEKMSADKAILITCKLETIKNNPKGRLRNIVSFLASKELIIAGFGFTWFLFVNSMKGIVTTLISSLRSPKTTVKKTIRY